MKYLIEGDAALLPCVEPEQRMVGGKFGWADHRFPIKGGISRLAVLGKVMAETLYHESNKRGFMSGFLAREKTEERVPHFNSVDSFKLKPTIVK